MPMLKHPLDREFFLKDLDETISKIKETDEAIKTVAVLLERSRMSLRAEWNRDEIHSQNTKTPSYIG